MMALPANECNRCQQFVPLLTNWAYCPYCGAPHPGPGSNAKHAVVTALSGRTRVGVRIADDVAYFDGPSQVSRAHDYVQKYAHTYEDNDEVFAGIKEKTT